MDYNLIIDDYIGNYGYSKQYVSRVLSNFRGKHIDVKVSSLGGSLEHGLDIRQQFIDHGDVTVYLSGGVASAATIIAMGAKRIVMSKYAMFLVHKCSNFIDAWGSYNADQMQQLIEELTANKLENDRLDVMIANLYAERCKKKVSDILNILKAGRWMTPEEALSLGFIDEIADSKEDAGAKVNLASSELRRKLNAFGLPTAGLESAVIPEGVCSPVVPQSSKIDSMEKIIFNFKSLAAFLKLDEIVPDNDGYVSIKADEAERVSEQLENLSNSCSEKESTISGLNKKINELVAQVDALKKAPGDETTEIEDETGNEPVNSIDMYNEIKAFL